MFRRLLLTALAAVLALLMTACVMELDNAGSMLSGALKEYKETVEMEGKYLGGQPMELNLDMKMAKAVLESTEDKLADARFSYSPEELKPEFIAKGDGISIRNRLEGYSLGKPVNNWDVKIADKVPVEIELRAEASDVKLDMSNMLVNSVDAVLNASSAKMYFDKQNKEMPDKFRLDAAASSAGIYGAADIGFETMDLDADASKIVLDLTGDIRRDGEVRIDANASAVRLRLPDDAGVRIVIDKYEISSVIIKNSKILSRSEKEYVSDNYENAGKTLKIYADLNLTTLTIE